MQKYLSTYFFKENCIFQGDVEHHHSSDRTNRGTPTFKSPSVGIARDFGKRDLEIEPEGIPKCLKIANLRQKWSRKQRC